MREQVGGEGAAEIGGLGIGSEVSISVFDLPRGDSRSGTVRQERHAIEDHSAVVVARERHRPLRLR